MKTMNSNIFRKGLLGVLLLCGAASCSDDHFDIKTTVASASNSVWQNMEAIAELDSLRMILSQAPLLRSNSDKSSATYQDLLSSSQYITVWAPKNGTYNAKRYLDLLELAKTLESTNPDSATLIRYEVGRQFVQNHLARFNYESNYGSQDVLLMNAKICDYNAGTGLFNKISLASDYTNVPSSNGVLHVLNGSSPFFMNMYEALTSTYDSLTTVFNSYTVREFSESGSVQGATNSSGQMMYADSVYTYSNALLTATLAAPANEDSLYIGFYPATNSAWTQTYNAVKKLYKYTNSYRTNWSSDLTQFSSTSTFNGDSLSNYNALLAFASSMFVSASSFGMSAKDDSAKIINYVVNADSLVSTGRTVWRKPASLLSGITPEKASNGYIFGLESFQFDPNKVWADNLSFPLQYSFNRASTTADDGGELVVLTTSTRNDSIYGEVDDDTYYRYATTGNGGIEARIRLSGVLSTNYKVLVTFVPNNIRISDMYENGVERQVITRVTADVYYDDATNMTTGMFNTVDSKPLRCPEADVSSTSLTAASKKTADFFVNQDSVKTYTVFGNLQFNRCYANLPSGTESFPFLVIRIPQAYNQRATRYGALNNKSFNIVKVVLVPVRDDE